MSATTNNNTRMSTTSPCVRTHRRIASAPQHPQVALHRHRGARLSTAAAAAAAESVQGGGCALQLQQLQLPGCRDDVTRKAASPSQQLSKLVKASRKQLERTCNNNKNSNKRGRPSVAAGFVVDDARGAEDAVLNQLLLELRREELHQVAPSGDGCATLPLTSLNAKSSPAAAAPPAPAPAEPQPHNTLLRLSAVIGGQDDAAAVEDPWEAGVDLSSELFAPRAYTVPGRVLVCQGSKCRAKGALGVLQAVQAVVGSGGGGAGDGAGEGVVQVLPCKCLGKCKQGAVLRVKQDGAGKCGIFTQVAPEQVPALLDLHFMASEPAPPPPLPEADKAPCCVECHTTSPVPVPVMA